MDPWSYSGTFRVAVDEARARRRRCMADSALDILPPDHVLTRIRLFMFDFAH